MSRQSQKPAAPKESSAVHSRSLKNSHLRIRVETETREWLEAQAAKERRSLSNYIVNLIEDARQAQEEAG